MYLRFLHDMRGLAILLVLLSHAKLFFHPPSPVSRWDNLLAAVVEDGTILFVFIAGFLFQHHLPRFRYGPYLSGKARYVALPYLVCSLPVLAYSWWRHRGVFAGRSEHTVFEDLATAAQALLTAQHMPIPFWFLPPILIIYLLAPVFAAMDRRPWLYWAVPALLLAACFEHLSLRYLDVWQDTANLIPVYLLGMVVSHHRERALELLHRFRHVLLAGTVLMLWLDPFLHQGGRIGSARAFSTENGVFDATYLQKVFLSLWLLAFFAQRDARETAAPSVVRRTLAWFGDRSFGIYFVHMYVVSYLAPPLLDRMPPLPANGLVPMLVAFAVYVPIALALLVAAKHLSGRASRYLIGC